MSIPALAADAAFTAALHRVPAHSVSAVLATYNRCPFDPAVRLRDNPLTWALDTLRGQAGDVLAEIVVVDDGSTDYTPDVLDVYQAAFGVPVRAIRLAAHAGAHAARNTAVAAAGCRWLLFGDDDCVFTPYAAAGAAHTMHILHEQDPASGAVMLPFYYRALRPHQCHPQAQIGRLDPARARFSTHFHTWPTEYGSNPPRLDSPAGIVAPLPVELIGGTALLDADALRRIGGFVDLSSWASSYSDHLHLSADLTDTGTRLWHCPDPRLSAAHLKWGAIGRYPMHPEDLTTPLPILDRPLADLVTLAAEPRADTGCRVPEHLFHEEMIGSFFAFFAGRSLPGASTWAARCWHDFVTHGQVYSAAVAETPPPEQRVAAWRTGLARGARAAAIGPTARTAAELATVLDRVCADVGQPPISP
ncbi:glycosyltransferase [Micromonospora sp. NPDC049900]|uniref:glycosyltransferase n=1 Tax=Micromonospora sp. NPDC049900 TaxID=3364275 RepID=UPI0037B49B83